MKKHYRINEVVQLTSVSIRTLHYYDEIKLLCPSYRTEGGHRLYSNHDLIKLQQIMTLKFMGFPLKEIQSLLQESDFNLHESLKIQANMLKKEAARIEMVSKLLAYLVDSFNRGEGMNWENIIKIIETLRLSELEKQKWYEKYLTQDEQNEMNTLFSGYSEEFWIDYHRRWVELFDEVRQCLDTDPESEIGLTLAKKWLSLVDEIYGGASDLTKKLWNGYKAGVIPENQLQYDSSVIAYITKACEKLNTSGKKLTFIKE